MNIKDAELEKLADYYADNCSYPQPGKEHFKTTYWIHHNIAVDAFKAGAVWQQSQQPEIDTKRKITNLENEVYELKLNVQHFKTENKKLQSQQPKEADGWISVEDRLPEHGQGVLIFISTGLITVGYLKKKNGIREWQLFGDVDVSLVVDLENDFATHWQPLPLPPKK